MKEEVLTTYDEKLDRTIVWRHTYALETDEELIAAYKAIREKYGADDEEPYTSLVKVELLGWYQGMPEKDETDYVVLNPGNFVANL